LNWTDPPTKCSSDELGDPSITYLDEDEVETSLVYEASIFRGIETWLNATYKIEWFDNGKSLKREEVCCGLPPGEQHKQSCESVANAKVRSILKPSKYTIGRRVSLEYIIFG